MELYDGKWLIGRGHMAAPSPSLILDADQVAALRGAFMAADEAVDDFGL